MCVMSKDPCTPEFVEVDPSGRYGRYDDVLGKGASKTVYMAFDEFEGIEVAWNQMRLQSCLPQCPDDPERLYCEIHLLNTLEHQNIIKFYSSWVDVPNGNMNFITELFTSGTLKQYRQKHKRVNMRVVKRWCRQILRGLLYLHGHEPPIVHRDIKCDNVFINGNQGEVKIGDLGLAAVLGKPHAKLCVGTPEFMAPEVYQEEYNELVDIYSFGMCILEMVTGEYPYSECTHPAQIYKKVISGIKPEAFYRVEDPETRVFLEKCLETASQRPSANELLKDPFLRDGILESNGIGICGVVRSPSLPCLSLRYDHESFRSDGCTSEGFAQEGHCKPDSKNLATYGMDLFDVHDDNRISDVDIRINSKMREDGGIFIWIRVVDSGGLMRNIYFPFDIEADSALIVATEMIMELDIADHDVMRIAEMIDGEISSLVPDWIPGPNTEGGGGGFRTPSVRRRRSSSSVFSSRVSFFDCLSAENQDSAGLHSNGGPQFECAALHGRFEQITYRVEEPYHSLAKGADWPSPGLSEELDPSSYQSLDSRSDENRTNPKGDLVNVEELQMKDIFELDDKCKAPFGSEAYEDEIKLELRWLKARYRMELEKLLGKQVIGGRDLKASLDTTTRIRDGVNRTASENYEVHPPLSQALDKKPTKSLPKHLSLCIAEKFSNIKSSAFANYRYLWSGQPRPRKAEDPKVVRHKT